MWFCKSNSLKKVIFIKGVVIFVIDPAVWVLIKATDYQKAWHGGWKPSFYDSWFYTFVVSYFGIKVITKNMALF